MTRHIPQIRVSGTEKDYGGVVCMQAPCCNIQLVLGVQWDGRDLFGLMCLCLANNDY